MFKNKFAQKLTSELYVQFFSLSAAADFKKLKQIECEHFPSPPHQPLQPPLPHSKKGT